MKNRAIFTSLLTGVVLITAPGVFAHSHKKGHEASTTTNGEYTTTATSNHTTSNGAATGSAMPVLTLLKDMKSKGYVAITRIELDNGTYKVDARTPTDRKVEISVNPQTGTIEGPKEASMHLNMENVVKKVQEAGYTNIHKIKANEDKYDVIAVDKDGKKVDLSIDAKTGEISKSWL